MTPEKITEALRYAQECRNKYELHQEYYLTTDAVEHCVKVMSIWDMIVDVLENARAEKWETMAKIVDYKPGSWFHAGTIDEMQAFYMSRLPAIREAAKEHGYAIGVHGSTRRDFDLIAVPWREEHSDKDTLAIAVHQAACGIAYKKITPEQWEQKPSGRWALALPVCWTAWHDMVSAGHIDLSVMILGEQGAEKGGTEK